MEFFSRIRTQVLSWSRDTPLPTNEPDAIPYFQSWHAFDSTSNRWSRLDLGGTAGDAPATTGGRTDGAPKAEEEVEEESDERERSRGLVLVTWNVDYSSKAPEARMAAILNHIRHLGTSAPAAPDVIFFQEVSRPALASALRDPWVREGWYSSEAADTTTTSWGKQSFATMVLVSRSRFSHARGGGDGGGVPGKATLGAIWRVKYPSRYERDALCCDVFLPSSSSSSSSSSSTSQPPSPPAAPSSTTTRVRLINVHLDSLPIQPSYRPQQLSIATSMLRAAGRGLVAGDFNPVLPSDETLLRDSRLVDAWAELRPDEPGFTWGIDGGQPFPPTRLDKVGMLGLRPEGIEVLLCGDVAARSSSSLRRQQQQQQQQRQQQEMEGETAAGQKQEEGSREVTIPWSDHAGLKCSFNLV